MQTSSNRISVWTSLCAFFCFFFFFSTRVGTVTVYGGGQCGYGIGLEVSRENEMEMEALGLLITGIIPEAQHWSYCEFFHRQHGHFTLCYTELALSNPTPHWANLPDLGHSYSRTITLRIQTNTCCGPHAHSCPNLRPITGIKQGDWYQGVHNLVVSFVILIVCTYIL